jgi:hypothetical protein
MRAYIIVEGQSDARILRALLPDELLEDTEIVSAGGASAAKSLARSLLVRRQTPVAIVMDADSVAPERIQECRQSIEEVVESVAGGVPVKAVVAAPAMETILFYDETMLARVFGPGLSEHLLSLARIQPQDALKKLFDQSDHVKNLDAILNSLTRQDIQILQKSSILQELIAFLQTTREFTTSS